VQRGVAAKLTSPHLPFGNPSEAGSAPNNQLALRPQVAASWNSSKRIPNWGVLSVTGLYLSHALSEPDESLDTYLRCALLMVIISRPLRVPRNFGKGSKPLPKLETLNPYHNLKERL
jgi:hypothetical protein